MYDVLTYDNIRLLRNAMDVDTSLFKSKSNTYSVFFLARVFALCIAAVGKLALIASGGSQCRLQQ